MIRSTASSRASSCAPSFAQSVHLQPWHNSLAAKHSQYLITRGKIWILSDKAKKAYNLRHRDFLQEHTLTLESESSPPVIPNPGVAGKFVIGLLRTL